ncbi:MAG TPA: UvrD-helicase domain-containing protein [Solirubrobacteraceae bacterium]|nr:UvrD-helicase domain-containing protein [Solirubrobacteraceae bacterium]
MIADARPFDVRGPLPSGVTVLEASAGTGKTYTIAALAARYVADGIPLERLLLVTFTRMATGELRERVRERLVSVEHGLGRALAGVPSTQDEVVALLAQGSADDVGERRARLAQALADFDAATIATTHGFCQEVLTGLGIAGDIDPDTTFVEDVRDLVEEIVDDLYVRRFHSADAPAFTRAQAAEIARVAIEHPDAPIVPAAGELAQMRRRLAEAVRKEFDQRKRRMAVMGYDDLLTRLQETLASDGGDAVAERLRARYSVVLVDEFQDTDPVQWDIVRRAFGGGGSTLVLIGDPKQAIYAFRGADVYAYLDAAGSAGARATLDVNWRSDQGLIDAYDTTFGGAKLGHEGIVYRRVRAADANRTPRLTGAPSPAPLRIRVVRRDEPGIALTAKGFANLGSAREHVAKDVAADLVTLLSSQAQIERRREDGTTGERERVGPGHVAVLVPTNRSAAWIRDALDAVGIPAVINGAGSVFGTPAAREWLRLLEAIERPASVTRARAAALTCFFGWSTEQVAAAGEDGGEELHRRLHDWGRALRVKGVASLTQTIMLCERLSRRVLATVDGERRLTDLRHVAQLLHAAAATEQLGTTALTAWLRRRIAEADQDTGDEERSRRLESDAAAVQVLTIHRSKGLEFPIVYLPFLWEPGRVPNGKQPVLFHDANAADARTIDLALQGSDFRRHHEQAVVEQRGEDLRLAYVALTRAQHQAVVWWAGSWDSRNSPLGRLLFERDADGNVAASGARVPTDTLAGERFAALAAEAPGCIGVERSTLGLPALWAPAAPDATTLEAASFHRNLDRSWRRTSYSDITAGAYEPWVASEPEDAAVIDEPSAVAPRHASAEAPGESPLAAPSLLGEMPVGLRVGTLVHRVLEATDFAAADLDAELGARIAAAQARRHVEIGDPAIVVAGLRAALETPLGPLLGGARLRDVARTDRLDELDFELPLAGGDDPTGQLALTAIGDALREHLPADDPLAGYARRLDDPVLRRDVRGYLTGSLDLVVRVPDAAGAPRFAVVDYKTNWLGPPDASLTAWHHRPSALAAEMRRAHYGLQALLYTAALHRYLRWRLPGYDPERNLAGVLYLFLRGMTGPDTPTVDGAPCGVFAWRPPAALVEALSDVLDGAVER